MIKEKKKNIFLKFIGTTLGRIFVSIFVPFIAFAILYIGFQFLKTSNAPKPVLTIIAIIWGVGGILLLYIIIDWLVKQFPAKICNALQPFVFVGPALIILTWYLVLPTFRSFFLSMFNPKGEFVFFGNYIKALLNGYFLKVIGNNIIWVIVGPGLSVFFGLVIALLADRSSFEVPAKALIFLPMAISFIGAGVIWKFIYAYKPPDEVQIGLLNAIVGLFGIKAKNWIIMYPLNSFLLVIILVWMQTGYAMVLISSAIKGVPDTLLEAARIDGAGEFKIILSVIIPYIKGTIITVATTIVILTLKIFDIVYPMTGGNYSTDVIATLQYKEMFVYKNYNMGSTYAIILLIAVLPAIFYNLKQFRERKAF